jgi:preprotein translocase subunit YajC
VSALAAVGYGALVRPQLRRAADHQAFVDSLRVGDRVVTGGGLIGQIARCNGTVVAVTFGDAIVIDVMRATIHGFAPR